MNKSLFKRLSRGFWRKDSAGKQGEEGPEPSRRHEPSTKRAGPEPHQPIRNDEGGEKDWFFVGNDEEGTPIYLDKNRMVRSSGSTLARVWLKYVPSPNAHSFEQAQQYLKEAGAEWKRLCYIEQLLELDVNADLMADLVLFFFDWNDQLIEQVQFRERTLRPLGTVAVYSTIKGIAAGEEERMEPEVSPEQPSIDEKIQLKLKEINEAFDAFDKS
jgi:hypothetical protein